MYDVYTADYSYRLGQGETVALMLGLLRSYLGRILGCDGVAATLPWPPPKKASQQLMQLICFTLLAPSFSTGACGALRTGTP